MLLRNNPYLTIGRTIRNSRMYKKLTQKQLGVSLGFPVKNAETRIGQYEVESRIPSPKFAEKLAEKLEISKYAISKLSVKSEIEVIHTLMKVDTIYGLEWKKCGNKVTLSFPDKFEIINKNLRIVHNARLGFDWGCISYEDYEYIKNSCSE